MCLLWKQARMVYARKRHARTKQPWHIQEQSRLQYLVSMCMYVNLSCGCVFMTYVYVSISQIRLHVHYASVLCKLYRNIHINTQIIQLHLYKYVLGVLLHNCCWCFVDGSCCLVITGKEFLLSSPSTVTHFSLHKTQMLKHTQHSERIKTANVLMCSGNE